MREPGPAPHASTPAWQPRGLGEGPTALLLSGGGALGAFEVGVLEALQSGRWAGGQFGRVDCSICSGISAGAFNAAFLASRGSFRQAVPELCRVWLNQIARWPGHRNGVFRVVGDSQVLLASLYGITTVLGLLSQPPASSSAVRQLIANLLSSPAGQLLQGTVNPVRYISSRPLANLIAHNIDLGRLLHHSAKPLLIAATRWRTGRPTVFYNREDLTERFYFLRYLRTELMTPTTADTAIRASAALPGIVPPVKLENTAFVDGSLLVTLPIQSVVDLGAKVVHVVFTEPPPSHLHPSWPPTTVQVLQQTLAAAAADQFRKDLQLTATLNTLSRSARQVEKSALTSQPPNEPIVQFLDRLAQRREVTVHLHYPQQKLTGLLDVLDFHRHQIQRLMSIGFDAAVSHDCATNGCLIPHAHEHHRPTEPLPHAPAQGPIPYPRGTSI